MITVTTIAASFIFAGVAKGHIAPWVEGMYCGNGTSNDNVPNVNTPVDPLYQLSQADFWFQHDRGCDAYPPPPGVFLELPAGGNFTVELAHNKGQTTLAGEGAGISDWPDGKEHPNDWNDPNCLQDDGAMHTTGEQGAAGTAWAISTESDLSKVTLENLVVFTVLQHTPWKRVATYQVPKDLPACPDEGCTCAWLWLPEGCGQPNEYMAGAKCKVTGSTSTKSLAPAKPPVPCADDDGKCVRGAKQMIVWNQKFDNVKPPSGFSPGYNEKMGFQPGPQDDIFVTSKRSMRPFSG